MEKLRIGCLASGSGSNFESIVNSCFNGLLNSSAEVAILISNIPDAKCLDRAKKYNIPSIVIPSKSFIGSREEYDQKLIEILKMNNVELICLTGYMRFVSKLFLDSFPGKVMNIHPALLPSFKGLHAQKAALDYGVKVAGCTVHFVDEKEDNGPIIIQKVVNVQEDDTEESLAARILQQEHIAFSEAIKLFAEKRLKIEGRKVKIFPHSI